MSSSLVGIAYMCLGVLCLALGDAVAKWLGQSFAPVQIIFFRTLVSLPLIALIASLNGGLRTLATTRPKVHLPAQSAPRLRRNPPTAARTAGKTHRFLNGGRVP